MTLVNWTKSNLNHGDTAIDSRREDQKYSLIPFGVIYIHPRVLSANLLFAIILVSSVTIVAALWGYFCLHSGFPYETGLIIPSDQQSGFAGLFYVDSLRIYTSLFYHLSYLIGLWVGTPGSYVPYQIVYAGLWIGRCLLTYGIVRVLLPAYPALAGICSLLVVLLANDASLNWVGQLNQFGFIFWMLCGFLFYAYAQKAQSNWRSIVLSAAAAFFIHLSLWSYESPLPVCAAFPLIVALVYRPLRFRRFAATTAIYAIPIVVFVLLNVHRYVQSSRANTYQSSVLRNDINPHTLLSDMALHLKNAFAFWSWPHSTWDPQLAGDYAAVFTIVASAVVASVVALIWSERSPRAETAVDVRLFLLALGSAGLLVASYAVAVLITNNTGMWRTEFLAHFATSLFAGVILYSALALLRLRPVRTLLLAIIFLPIAFFSALNGVNTGNNNREIWDRHRALIASIVAQLPQLVDGSLVVLRGVPERLFGHNMWFDLAVRAAYPGRLVAGVYYRVDGRPAPGANISLSQGFPEILPEGFGTVFHQSGTKIKHVEVLDFNQFTGQTQLVVQGPVNVTGHVLVDPYQPCLAVNGDTPSKIAINRYAPISTTASTPCVGETQP